MTPPSPLSPVQIRAAVAADLEGVRRLLVETGHDTYDSLLGPQKVEEITGTWRALPVLARQLGAAATSFLVAEYHGRIVGHALVDFRSPVATLARLHVLPAWQRRGIGRQLLAVALAGREGIERVTLNVEAENGKAVTFYRREGFAVTGRAPVDGVGCLQIERRMGDPDVEFAALPQFGRTP